MLLIPTGFTGSSKTPGAVSEVRYGQGAGTIGDNPRELLLVGYKLGNNLADYEVFDINDPDEGVGLATAGSELAGMIRHAFIPGVILKGLAVPEPSGGVQATLDIVVSGSWTTSGSFILWLDDHYFNIPISGSDSATTAGDTIEEEIFTDQDIFCSPNNVTGTVTCTVKNKGGRGNEHFAWVDKKLLPSGCDVTLTGGTVRSNGAVPFSSGSGVETIANVLAASIDARYDYTAWAVTTATETAAVCAQAAAKAGPFGAGPENVIFGNAADLISTAVSFTQANANQALAQMVWMSSRQYPANLSASMGALRSVTEAAPVSEFGNPNARYDNVELPHTPGHFRKEYTPGRSVTDASLNGGVTPIVTVNGTARVCRAITTRSLNGSAPDYRTLDTGDAVVPQRIREDIDNLWTNEHAPNNPHVGPDLPDGQLPPEGVSTPSLWGSEIRGRLAAAEDANLIMEVDENQPAVVYNKTLKALVSNIPTIVRPINHQTATVIRQVPA